jgi:hypothetical protein
MTCQSRKDAERLEVPEISRRRIAGERFLSLAGRFYAFDLARNNTNCGT